MQIFQSSDAYTFRYNGIKYVKNYLVLKIGDTHIAVLNAYDTKLQLMPSTLYSNVSVNGIVYTNQSDLMSALTTIIFSKQVVDVDYLGIIKWQSGSTGNYSVATINDTGTDATGSYAVAEGHTTLAAGTASHAEGFFTQALGEESHAEGASTIARGSYSHAGGRENEANTYAETVIGCYSQNLSGDTNSFYTGDTVFRVGIGTGPSYRKDGFRIYKDGKVQITQPVVNNTIANIYGRAADGSFGLIEKSSLIVANELQTRAKSFTYSTDFLNNNASANPPFIGAAINGGSCTVASQAMSSFGLVSLYSAAAINSGYRWKDGNGTVQISEPSSKGIQTDLLIGFKSSSDGGLIRFGFTDSSTSTDATWGLYFEIANRVVFAKTANGTRTSVQLYTIPQFTSSIYHLRVRYLGVGLGCLFEVYASYGALLASTTITTNIPSQNSSLGCGVIATTTIASAINLCDLDYLGVTRPENGSQNRGALN